MNKSKQLKNYRIKKIQYKNHTEYWIEKSIRFLGIHLFWDKTTLSYYREEQSAIDDLESIIGDKIITIKQIQIKRATPKHRPKKKTTRQPFTVVLFVPPASSVWIVPKQTGHPD